ncbi:hypothetical protein AB0K51_33565 [Kitasatospora sp. NPDC049285]|uniref:hypothetical protein n=1 Tax=Kitasatospora sp. NPDC049285 TaxID=3157096 RepID=UPI003445D552
MHWAVWPPAAARRGGGGIATPGHRHAHVTLLHRVVPTLPADGGRPWSVGGPAEVTPKADAPVAVRKQREDPGLPCPCTAHTTP